VDTHDRRSGAGGFNLRAVCDVPVHVDLRTAEGRAAAGLRDAEDVLGGTEIVSLRVSEGDDASCLNMQRPDNPRVLGVPPELIEREGFTFTSIAADLGFEDARANPWRLLDADLPGADGGAPVIPAFADAASAQWILKVGLGDEVVVPGVGGEPVRLRLVGLLAGSIFQSELLVSERRFRSHFGTDSGYRYFLVETPRDREEDVRRALAEGLGSLGLGIDRTADVLAGYARVQNTYLATFQTLGGLGLLLGTFGVVAVLLRGVVERRGELAMMLALGLQRPRLVAMIVLENGVLLLLGVIIGATAALVAVAPHVMSTLADVNWAVLAGTLGVCVLTGLASCALSAALSMRGELLAALRAE